jgi:Fur family ferric uptake transcriptional regulator
MESPAINILEQFDLRKTSVRIQMLELFFQTPFAVTATRLEENLSAFDRVTIYRTLQTFLEKEIVHKIPDESGAARFALQQSTASPHISDHVHFKCTKCGLTRCIYDVPVPAISLPKGYKAMQVSYVVQGLCPDCAIA